ncbi:hypothetical protein Tco_0407650 [Tanacetum coccineum]
MNLLDKISSISIGSSDVQPSESPYLPVLFIGTSQSRQHDKSESGGLCTGSMILVFNVSNQPCDSDSICSDPVSSRALIGSLKLEGHVAMKKAQGEAIKKRYRGNKESKKVQMTLLKQQHENFAALSSETMDQTFDRLQKLISQLEIQGEVINQEDMNLKLLRSLPSEWKTYALIWRNKVEIETISLDDLYNNLKIYEPKITGSSNTSKNTQNVAFVFNGTNNTNNTNKVDDTAHGVSTTHTQDYGSDSHAEGLHNHVFINNDVVNQAVQMMPSSQQSNVVNHSETEITSDSNIILILINIKSVEISVLNASLQEKALAITAFKDELRKLKGKALVDNNVSNHPSDPELHQEEAAVLRDLVDHIKANYPLDPLLESALIDQFLVTRTGSPSSTTVDQDAPSVSNSQTTPKTEPPVILNDVEEDNHDIEVGHMGNDPYFGVPIQKLPFICINIHYRILSDEAMHERYGSSYPDPDYVMDDYFEVDLQSETRTLLGGILKNKARLVAWVTVKRRESILKSLLPHCREKRFYVSQSDGFVDKDNPQSHNFCSALRLSAIYIVHPQRRGIFINQSKYALESLKKYGFDSCDPVDTPMLQSDLTTYCYMHVCPVQGSVPTEKNALKCVNLKDLSVSKSKPFYIGGLWYPKDSSIALTAFADADHAGCQDTRHSTSGSMYFWGDRIVSWSSKIRKALRYPVRKLNILLCPAVVLNLWMRSLRIAMALDSIKFQCYCDKHKALLPYAVTTLKHSRSKHIVSDLHFITVACFDEWELCTIHSPLRSLLNGQERICFKISWRYTHFYRLSHFELVDIKKVALALGIRSLNSKCTIDIINIRVLRIILVILPEHQSDTQVITVKIEILLEPTSNKLMVGNGSRLFKDGGGVKEFQRSFRHSDTERLSRSDEVLKLKNFKKDATLKFSKSTNQERYEHDWSRSRKFTRWQSFKMAKRLCLVDDLKMLKITMSNTSSRNKLYPEINDHYNIFTRESQEYELKTKDKA